MRTIVATAAILLALPGILASSALANEGNRVVATIKPLHSLVAGVMLGVGTPELLIPGTTSPHAFTLKPSDARKLENARVVFWIGPDLETALEAPLKTLADEGRVETMMRAPGIVHRAYADGHEHGHDDAHGHKEEHKKDEKDHGDHAGHDHHGEDDPHIWLDPENARAMVALIAAVLTDAMPEHADKFASNRAKLEAELGSLTDEVSAILKPVWFKPFLTFHDAFGHFEKRFGLSSGEAISLNPEVKPGAKRIAELRAEIKEDGFACVFIEPQFNPAIAEVIVEGTGTHIATLDPLGSHLEAGPAMYVALVREIAKTLRDCMER
ncbi:MAG: zinc ABC transporter substrate-binding protein [Alphaproteobacteria bacterium]|nr:zinc ABC transporter substrate-binding protein [Alphaproteobacteria bacterium]